MRQGYKHKKDIILQENAGKKTRILHRLHDTVTCHRRGVVSLSFFPQVFHSRVAFLCFHPCLVSVPFMDTSLNVVNFYRIFLSLVYDGNQLAWLLKECNYNLPVYLSDHPEKLILQVWCGSVHNSQVILHDQLNRNVVQQYSITHLILLTVTKAMQEKGEKSSNIQQKISQFKLS